jgi:hypothetical protein
LEAFQVTKAHRAAFLVLVVIAISTSALSQDTKAGVLTAQELKRVVPASYFFDGQSASVQLRNSVGLRTSAGKMVLAGMVDTSGYSADVQQKYQGFFITEAKLTIEGKELVPGEYGFGFTKDGKFLMMDVGASELINVSANSDDKLARPVPLKVVEENGAYKLYAGKKWVGIKPE